MQLICKFRPILLIEKLSPGERQLAEIAKAFQLSAKLIIFDEPATSLTAARNGASLRADRAAAQQRPRPIVYISHILGDVMRLADEIAVLRDGELVGQGHKDEFTIGRMISLMVGRDIKQLYPERTGQPTTVPALEYTACPHRYRRANRLYPPQGRNAGHLGLMGSGRTELARILFGMDSYERGEIEVNGTPP